MYKQGRERSNEIWSIATLQSYFNYVKANFAPKLSENASEVLIKYWKTQRGADSRVASRTTIRLLESSIRLAQGKIFIFIISCVMERC
jgi:DNA helicase MCM9